MSYPVSWYDRAVEIIDELHATLPADISFEERRKAVSAAYCWGERRYHPYKMWLKAQKRYLARHDPAPAGPLDLPLSPLERMKAKSEQ